MNFKSELAPKGLQFNPSDFVISDKYATILTIVSYPKYIVPGYLSSLTNMSGIKLIIAVIPCGTVLVGITITSLSFTNDGSILSTVKALSLRGCFNILYDNVCVKMM